MKLSVIIVSVVLICILFSCHVQKEITSSHVNVDSIVNQVRKKDSIAVFELKRKHQQELIDARKSSVIFKDKPCPEFPRIDSSCNKDSLVKIIRQLLDLNASLKNSVTYYKDGSIKVQGDLGAVNLTLLRTQRENSELDSNNKILSHSVDSLGAQKSVAKSDKERTVKKTFIPTWMWIIILITGGLYVYEKFIKKK